MQHKVTEITIIKYDGAYQASLRPPGRKSTNKYLTLHTPNHSDEKQIHTFLEHLCRHLWTSYVALYFRCFIEPSKVILWTSLSPAASPPVSFAPPPDFLHHNLSKFVLPLIVHLTLIHFEPQFCPIDLRSTCVVEIGV